MHLLTVNTTKLNYSLKNLKNCNYWFYYAKIKVSYVPKNVVVSGNRSSTLGGTGANLVVLPSQPQPFQSYRFRMVTSTFPYEGSCSYNLFKLRSLGTIGMVYKKSSLLTFKKKLHSAHLHRL